MILGVSKKFLDTVETHTEYEPECWNLLEKLVFSVHCPKVGVPWELLVNQSNYCFLTCDSNLFGKTHGISFFKKINLFFIEG